MNFDRGDNADCQGALYVPQAGDAGDEDEHRIGSEGNPPAQATWWTGDSSAAGVDLHVFRRQPSVRKPSWTFPETGKTPSWRSAARQRFPSK